MAIVITEEGGENILKYTLGVSTSTETLKMKLYSNNVIPVATSVAGDFTEVTGGGYAEKSLNASSWTISGKVASSNAHCLPSHLTSVKFMVIIWLVLQVVS